MVEIRALGQTEKRNHAMRIPLVQVKENASFVYHFNGRFFHPLTITSTMLLTLKMQM